MTTICRFKGEGSMRDLRPEPSSCQFYKGIEKCNEICMFDVFGVCTNQGSKFKERKDDTDEF